MKPRVLIVDDSWSMRQTLRLLLSPDFECAIAEDGLSALELARKSPPDIIVSDVNMEGMDGYELCRQVRAEPSLKHVPFLFISGHAPRPGIPEAADAYLIKPVQPAVLIARLHEMLQPRPLPELQAQIQVQS
ncbi:PleD family two-component system response regulator [Vitiosangium sp. GDMCC 1.1324]|uniref:response regulator n=1 Tax=Vitiosangium sp. (strain GDMCC 1.1324) TaxID=2138576 RepID=UPI000D37E474|nr:response regulator [Vitiosangium sp. GDMCC 1.1324]PTL83782.1 two-component system response regulator [Vitiosangium sp. GDMCC 1.1324]